MHHDMFWSTLATLLASAMEISVLLAYGAASNGFGLAAALARYFPAPAILTSGLSASAAAAVPWWRDATTLGWIAAMP
jgi:sterol desaturase/sphingolipid hydroxylase (fatty acid hydroxylase superfamily)